MDLGGIFILEDRIQQLKKNSMHDKTKGRIFTFLSKWRSISVTSSSSTEKSRSKKDNSTDEYTKTNITPYKKL